MISLTPTLSKLFQNILCEMLNNWAPVGTINNITTIQILMTTLYVTRDYLMGIIGKYEVSLVKFQWNQF